MGSSLKFHLTETELEAVCEAMNHDPRPEVRQRATAIQLLYRNHKPAEVAEMIAVTPATIYNWWQRWQSNGVEGLANRAKSGRPPKADASFIAFLVHLLTVYYPTQRLVLVLDNASYHKSYAVLAALSLLQDRLQVIWLPKYCPYLNPIERFWLQLKNRASANQLHRNPEVLDLAISRVVANQNTLGHPDRLEMTDHLQLVA